MINSEYNLNIPRDLIKFHQAEPFHHLVLDDFISDKDLVSSVANEVKIIPNEVYGFEQHRGVQIKKRGLSDLKKLPPNTVKLIEFFQSQEMIQYLQNITGITNLLPDPALLGGGLHKMDTGGHLAVHADFNIHKDTGYHRRVNALLYLNENWEEEWGGELQLWDGKMTKCYHKVMPLLNRLVVFRITDDAFHGHPDPLNTPEDVSRYSLAFYYYTVDRPEKEKSPFHWALWQKRPDGNF
jgi:hypothetical protein